MSRRSDNSKAGSEGNGDSMLSSYQNSPRKTPEFGSAGPFGDHCRKPKSSNCYIFMMNNDSSPESEDQEACDLKAEYLERLNLIREKLASIDIANYGSYYRNCCSYSSSCSPRCHITEIFDECSNDSEDIDTNKRNDATVIELVARKSSNHVTTTSTRDENRLIQNFDDKDVPHEEEGDRESNAESEINLTKNVSNTKKELPDNNLTSYHDPKYTKAVENIPMINTNIKDSRTECDASLDPISKKFEVKTIFKYDNPFNVESSMELIDLNYNPPKKKHCVRETTPKIIMSDGAMSLPYHIRVSLHSEPLNSKEGPIEIIESINVGDELKINTENLPVIVNDITEEKINHIFPEVQVDCFGGGDQEKFVKTPCEGMLKYMGKQVGVESPRKSPGTENEYNVFFFETLEQSPSESIRSHKTVVTETTVTTDSPSRNPKRRRLLLRSAQNKVKPIDTISLWEEIRTMEALNKTKQEESSSSLESYFKDVIVYKNKTEPQIDLVSVGSFDVPLKTKPPSKFPSVTRITKFCSSIFRKKSKIIIEESTDQNGEPLEKKLHKKRVILPSPTAAHMLLNVRKEQDLEDDFDRLTLTAENLSERSSVDDEDDSYYDGMCPGCFCF